MKRTLRITMVLGLVGVLSVIVGCPKAKEQSPSGKVNTKEMNKTGEPATQEVADFSDNIFTITLKKGLIKIELEMVLVPAGKFMMGFTKKEREDFKVLEKNMKRITKKELGKEDLDAVDQLADKQGRQHEVTLTKPFYMGKYEVTQEQYEAVMGKNPSTTKGAKLPVTDLSWEDCQDFIKKLNAKTNGGYRLPSESEWEYACRAGTTTAYSFGDKITPMDANYTGDIKAVGSYKPNAFGLYDMHGNIGEWCEDWHGEYPFAITDPKGPATGKFRISRGTFGNIAIDFEYYNYAGSRNYGFPTGSGGFSSHGFRLAKTK